MYHKSLLFPPSNSSENVKDPLTNADHFISFQWSQQHKPSQRLRESIDQGLIAFQSVFDDYEGHEEYLIQRELSHPLTFAANRVDSDTMHMRQAMRQPDRKQFVMAMQDEINAHTKNRHWEVIERLQVSEGAKILPSVWAMKRKRRVSTKEVYKWKAWLNPYGGKQEHGINYWETYAATLAWSAIWFLLTQSLITGWHTRQIDFILAYPQANAECQLFMEIPKGFNVSGGNNNHCHKILKNIYGQRQASRIWSLHLKKGLQACGFTQSQVDECVFYNDTVIFMVYVDNTILLSSHNKSINASLQALQARFNLTEEGDIADYLGLQVTRLSTGTLSLMQPQLIASILKDLNFAKNTKAKNTPAASTHLL
jgi:Reverse transcriptase (RNA-dependent DNA polymerase)